MRADGGPPFGLEPQAEGLGHRRDVVVERLVRRHMAGSLDGADPSSAGHRGRLNHARKATAPRPAPRPYAAFWARILLSRGRWHRICGEWELARRSAG